VDGRRIRYIGINAPETAHAETSRKAEPFAYEALAYNKHLVYRKRIRIVFDAEKKDRYARWLAYVLLPDGRFVNLKLLEMGLAYCLPKDPNRTYDARFLRAQRSAMAARRGIWAQFDRNESTRYLGNRRSRRFHRTTCPFAHRISASHRVVFSNQWEAFWAGYAPAKGCMAQATGGGR
jgi:endonuclease YncB( thermonuclease family)